MLNWLQIKMIASLIFLFFISLCHADEDLVWSSDKWLKQLTNSEISLGDLDHSVQSQFKQITHTNSTHKNKDIYIVGELKDRKLISLVFHEHKLESVSIGYIGNPTDDLIKFFSEFEKLSSVRILVSGSKRYPVFYNQSDNDITLLTHIHSKLPRITVTFAAKDYLQLEQYLEPLESDSTVILNARDALRAP